ncbi:MAG: hypothetical protein IPL79_03600 [Myxococcales bacterium]|nr:hypothetical protein [Myxococcales bacterium]
MSKAYVLIMFSLAMLLDESRIRFLNKRGPGAEHPFCRESAAHACVINGRGAAKRRAAWCRRASTTTATPSAKIPGDLVGQAVVDVPSTDVMLVCNTKL